MKLKEYLKELERMAKENPETLEYEVIYCVDDEGNAYNKVNYLPSRMSVSNIEENRYLEPVEQEPHDEDFPGYNCVIVN